MIDTFRYPDKPTRSTADFFSQLREDEWLCTKKYDGWRAQGYPNGKLVSSKGTPTEELNHKVPEEIVKLWREWNLDAVMDFEFIGPRGSHSPAFYILDCLGWDGKWLTKMPHVERWDICQELSTRIPSDCPLYLAEVVDENYLDAFWQMKQDWIEAGKGLSLYEGLVVKRKRGTLQLKLTSHAKSIHQFKIRFREIREEVLR